MFSGVSTHRFGGRHLINLCKESFSSLDRTAQCDDPAVRMRCVTSLAGSTLPADEGMASTEARRECETEACSKDAKLQCPTCIKLGIQSSYFCSQVLLFFFFFVIVRLKGRTSPWVRPGHTELLAVMLGRRFW